MFIYIRRVPSRQTLTTVKFNKMVLQYEVIEFSCVNTKKLIIIFYRQFDSYSVFKHFKLMTTLFLLIYLRNIICVKT